MSNITEDDFLEGCDNWREYDGEDDERFCARCFAGVWSDEHHTKCVVTGHAEDGESA